MSSKAIAAAALLGAATAAGLPAAPSRAAESTGAFSVRVVLDAADPGTDIGMCRAKQATQGSTVAATVVCGPSPAPKPGTFHTVASTLLFHISRAGEWLGTIDEPVSPGTVTSWRVIRLADREYLEMTVGW